MQSPMVSVHHEVSTCDEACKTLHREDDSQSFLPDLWVVLFRFKEDPHGEVDWTFGAISFDAEKNRSDAVCWSVNWYSLVILRVVVRKIY